MTDRTVHARYPGMQIVRYDKAGKWFLEPTDACARRQVSLGDAARQAVWGEEHVGGEIFVGKPGGSAFDRIVRIGRG